MTNRRFSALRSFSGLLTAAFLVTSLAAAAPVEAKSNWVWCSDHKCSQRLTFSSYKACREYSKRNGGYCY